MNSSIFFIDALVVKYPIIGLAVNGYEIINVVWNLFLLLVPFLLFLLIRRVMRFKWRKALKGAAASFLFLLWLFFVPNSAYIITDVRHLLDYCPLNQHRVCVDNAWMIMFFFFYSLIGWLAFVFLLRQMRSLIREYFCSRAAKIFIIVIIPLISLGVMLGLVNRWNSWDVFVDPTGIVNGIFMYFSQLAYFTNWLLFTGFLYILYGIGDRVCRR